MVYPYSGQLAIVNLVIWLVLILKYKKVYFREQCVSGNHVVLICFATLFCTFAFSEADTYHYHTLYDKMLLFNERTHVEPFYYWLVKVLPHNYYVWRCGIWGVAMLLFIGTAKRYDINPMTLCFVFPMILMQQFALTRGALGIALFLFSSSYIIKPGSNRIISCILGIVGCVVSLYLHKSLPLFAFIALFAFVPLKKWTLAVLLVMFPVIRGFIIPFVFEMLGTSFFSEETVEFAANYLEREQSKANFNGMIRYVVDYTPRFMCFFILVREFVFKAKFKTPKEIKILFQYSFLLFYVALLFWGQNTSSFVTNRTLHMMCFPLTITLSYILYTTKRNKLTKITMLLFLFSDLFAFSYTIYSCW